MCPSNSVGQTLTSSLKGIMFKTNSYYQLLLFSARERILFEILYVYNLYSLQFLS